MDRHPDPDFLGDRDHRAQEPREVVAQSLRAHLAVAVEHAAQAWDVVAIEGAWQARHDVGEQPLLVAFGCAIEPGSSTREHLGRMVRLGTGTLQHEAVESREFVGIEAQCRPAARQRMGQFRSCPVEHGHEVVADRGNAAAGEVAQRLPIVVEQRLQIALAELDGLVHRQALDDAPAQAEGGIPAISALRASISSTLQTTP